MRKSFALVPLALAAAFVVVWSLGFFYWQIRLHLSLENFRSGWRDHWQSVEPDHRLPRALGSRAIPRLFRELEAELKKPVRDPRLVLAWNFELQRAIETAEEGRVDLSLSARAFPNRILDGSSMHFFLRGWWERNESDFPSAWQWWWGTRRRPPEPGLDPYPEKCSTVNP